MCMNSKYHSGLEMGKRAQTSIFSFQNKAGQFYNNNKIDF